MPTLDPKNKETVVNSVRDKYAAIALEGGSCCGPTGCGDTSEQALTLALAVVGKVLIDGRSAFRLTEHRCTQFPDRQTFEGLELLLAHGLLLTQDLLRRLKVTLRNKHQLSAQSAELARLRPVAWRQ